MIAPAYPHVTSEAMLRELDARLYLNTLPAAGDWDDSTPDGRVPLHIKDNAARLLRWAREKPRV